MKNTVKITEEQIKGMHEHLSGLPKGSSQRKDLKIFYHPMTPKDIYIRYSTCSLKSDNSIVSEIILNKIRPDGFKTNCSDDFDNLNQRLEFESQFLEIDLDANRNIVFV